jgi:hypothetical protein
MVYGGSSDSKAAGVRKPGGFALSLPGAAVIEAGLGERYACRDCHCVFCCCFDVPELWRVRSGRSAQCYAYAQRHAEP